MGELYSATTVSYRPEQGFAVRSQLRALVVVDDDPSADHGAVWIRMVLRVIIIRGSKSSPYSVCRQRRRRRTVQKSSFPKFKGFGSVVYYFHQHRARTPAPASESRNRNAEGSRVSNSWG